MATMTAWREWARRRRVERRTRLLVAHNGYVRGWHRGCPAASPGFLGTYKLKLDERGDVYCEACGATDLLHPGGTPAWRP